MLLGILWTTIAFTMDCLQSFGVIVEQCFGCWLPLLLVLTLGGDEIWLLLSCNYVSASPWSW